ncbi:MAG: helix-turn-helix domain-containing protein [Bacteroidaceae bacterium]
MVDIKKVIREHGFTLEKVGQEIGASKSSMTQYVSGNPTLNTLQKIAGVLGIPVSELVRDNERPSGAILCPHCGKPLNIKVEG